jgi:TPR repeat protein
VIIVGLLAILLGELAIYLLKPAGQGAYTACLEQAVAAAKNKDAKAFKTSLTRFSDTLDRNDIAPAALSKKNRALYTEALYQGMDRMGTTAISEATAAKALEFLRYDIENNPRNMLTLGRLYEAGKGVEQNDVLAGQWVERAAERGDVDAIYTIGSWYAFGVGRKEDYPKAISWLEKGSEKGDARAMVLLGLMYQEGIGVNRDYVQARHWYEQAAEKGNSEAMNSLGVLYAQGQGVAQDNAKADYWFEQVRKKQIVPDSAYFAFNKMFPVEKPSPMSFFSPHKVAQYASFKCSHGATDELLNEMKHVEKDTALGETFLSNLQLFGPDLERYENDRIYLAFYSYAKNRDVSVWYYYLVNEKGEFLEHKPWISLHRSNETGRCALTGIFEGTDDLMPAGVITN